MISDGAKRPTYRILLLEDQADAPPVERELRRAGLSFLSKRVETKDAFREQLEAFAPDVILADHSLPGFTAEDALEVVRTRDPFVAFLLVTDAQSEEVAVRCMKAGADDYLLKSSLERLPSAVQSALQHKEIERERAAAESALRRSEKRFRLLTQHARDLLCMVDGEGRFLYASPSFERVLGFAPAELIGTPAVALVHPEDRAAAEKAAAVTRTKGLHPEVEFRCRRRDGEWIVVEAVGEWAVENGEGEYAVIVARDVTDRRRLEGELFEAQKMEAVRRLAGGIAHDFNNLLTAIKGHSELLLDVLLEDDPLRPHAGEIRRAADRAAALTRQLVAFSRRQVVTLQDVDLNRALEEMEGAVRRLVGPRIELTLEKETGIGFVQADPDQIREMVRHLVRNARDAMPEGGTLWIRTANADLDLAAARRHVGVQPGAYVVLEVRDTGCGMDARTRASIFEPFFTTKPLGEGSGLGLSVVYGIVKQCAGAIEVEGQPGSGTTFRIYLPRIAAERNGRAAAIEGSRGAGRTVLVAEDDETVRRLVEVVLTHEGFTVLSARSGAEALRLCERREGPIDLLVTDVVMPDLSGPELAERAGALRPEMPVLYLSAYTGDALVDRGLLQPGVEFLPKPFTLDALLTKVHVVLGRPRLRR